MVNNEQLANIFIKMAKLQDENFKLRMGLDAIRNQIDNILKRIKENNDR